MQKKPLRRYLHVAQVFLRTPLVKAKRGFPEPLSGVKRKIFSLNVFVAEAWKVAARRKKLSSQSFLTGEIFSDYVCRIDDILDQVMRPSVITERPKYKGDKVARERISRFVGQVKRLSLTKQEKNEIFRLTGGFRRSAFATLAKFEKISKLTKQDIIKMKEHTAGAFGSVGISIINVCERIPREERKELEDAFSNSFMAVQIADDIFDVRIDRENRVSNIALAVLWERPNELEKVLKRHKINLRWFRKNCPESYKELMGLCEGYISKIPETTVGLQTLATIPKLFWKMAQLTSR